LSIFSFEQENAALSLDNNPLSFGNTIYFLNMEAEPMSQRTDRLPGTREGQLTMSKDWHSVAGTNAEAWGIPAAALQELSALTQTANTTTLTTAKNETTRTPVATAQCREAFEALTAAMRDMKKRYFIAPPLQKSDLIALGLKPHDTTPTPSGKPKSEVTVKTYLIGRHELGIKTVYVTGSPGDPANKGYRVWYSVVAPGETPPR
jgi:hypothetical protein